MKVYILIGTLSDRQTGIAKTSKILGVYLTMGETLSAQASDAVLKNNFFMINIEEHEISQRNMIAYIVMGLYWDKNVDPEIVGVYDSLDKAKNLANNYNELTRFFDETKIIEKKVE